MVVNESSYLGAARSNQDVFFSAINNDFARISSLNKDGLPVEAVDVNITMLAGLDADITIALGALMSEEPISKEFRKAGRLAARDSLSIVWTNAVNNFKVIEDLDLDDCLEDLATYTMQRHESVLQPGWNATILEHWTRLGSRNAFLPLMWSFIGSRFGKPYRGPDTKLVNDALTKTACISEFLDKLYARNLQSGLSKSDHARVYDHRSMLLEYEALLWLYEKGFDGKAGQTTWLFPSPPAMDYGKGDLSGRKVDIVGIVFEHGTPQYEFSFDVKQKHRTQQQHAKGGFYLLSALDIGCERYGNGRTWYDYTAVSRGHINSNATVDPYSRYVDPKFRTAVALASLGVVLDNIDTKPPVCLE